MSREMGGTCAAQPFMLSSLRAGQRRGAGRPIRVRVRAPRRAHHGLGQRRQAAEQRGHHAAAPQRVPRQPRAARRRALARALPSPCAAHGPACASMLGHCGFHTESACKPAPHRSM